MDFFERLRIGIPVAGALSEISAQPDLWNLFTFRQEASGSAHHATQCIVLRGPAAYDHASVFGDLTAEWMATIAQLPSTQQVLMQAIEAIGDIAQLGRIMIVNLPAGARIDQHDDQGSYAEFYSRFHVVLTSPPGNWFFCAHEAVHMREGDVWRFDHHQQHSVANLSSEDRIHIIIDARLAAAEGN